MKSLNIMIREIREDHDMTQKQVAEALGIKQQYYSKYETGEYELPIRHLIALSKLYQLSTDYLLGLTQYQFSLDKLQQSYLDQVQTGKFLSDALTLDEKGRKTLLEYLEFLKEKYLQKY